MRNTPLKKIVAASFALAGVIAGVAVSRASTSRNASSQGSGTGRSDAGKVQELNVTIKEWAVPTKGAHPHDPAIGADGALWFTEQMANKIGRLDPKTGEFKEYPLKVTNSGPHGLVEDGEANIWFTANFAGKPRIPPARTASPAPRRPTRAALLSSCCSVVLRLGRDLV
jgi:streptogramin lyase